MKRRKKINETISKGDDCKCNERGEGKDAGRLLVWKVKGKVVMLKVEMEFVLYFFWEGPGWQGARVAAAAGDDWMDGKRIIS